MPLFKSFGLRHLFARPRDCLSNGQAARINARLLPARCQRGIISSQRPCDDRLCMTDKQPCLLSST